LELFIYQTSVLGVCYVHSSYAECEWTLFVFVGLMRVFW
jgi:hypothetical protein